MFSSAVKLCKGVGLALLCAAPFGSSGTAEATVLGTFDFLPRYFLDNGGTYNPQTGENQDLYLYGQSGTGTISYDNGVLTVDGTGSGLIHRYTDLGPGSGILGSAISNQQYTTSFHIEYDHVTQQTNPDGYVGFVSNGSQGFGSITISGFENYNGLYGDVQVWDNAMTLPVWSNQPATFYLYETQGGNYQGEHPYGPGLEFLSWFMSLNEFFVPQDIGNCGCNGGFFNCNDVYAIKGDLIGHQTSEVPEPMTMGLVAVGLAGGILRRRKLLA